MMNLVAQRNFTVDYFEKEANLWRVFSHLTDAVHDILVEVDVAAPDMVIRDAAFKFARYPMAECQLFAKKAALLVGLNITKDFPKCRSLMMGPEGCSNVMLLLSVALPGFAYFYYPHLLRTGQMNPGEWERMVRTDMGQDCLAHSIHHGFITAPANPAPLST